VFLFQENGLGGQDEVELVCRVLFIVFAYVGLEGFFDQGVGGGGRVEAQDLADEVHKGCLFAGIEIGKALGAGAAGKTGEAG